MRTIIILLLLRIFGTVSPQQQIEKIYYGKLTGRVIQWPWPTTDWTWDRSLFIGSDEYGWKDISKHCTWSPRQVKIKCTFTLGKEFKIVLKNLFKENP